MKKIAIIGASYLQLPLIRKAKKMGLITHVFAWKANDVGEKEADYFYPISIIEKEEILKKCIEVHIDGICSIASDLAIITVNYVAQNMGLVSNDFNCTVKSTNKHFMRKCFEENNDPSPKSILVDSIDDLNQKNLVYPLIVKPIDRSGSRGITKVFNDSELIFAIEKAKHVGFDKKALVEEYADGQEYSVESISWNGIHTILTVTKKYTTGSPNFIETGHLEPADISDILFIKTKNTINHALNSLGIKYGASHSEIKIDTKGNIKLIEIGGRMGGDMIGSSLVELSTGFDYVKSVIDVSLGNKPDNYDNKRIQNAGIKFLFNKNDYVLFEAARKNKKIKIIDYFIDGSNFSETVTDSSNRHGYYIMVSNNADEIKQILEK